MFQNPSFIQWYLRDIIQDTAGFAGTELIRRVVGSAKVKDVECIADAQARLRMERICILAAKELIFHRMDGFERGADYGALLRTISEKNH